MNTPLDQPEHDPILLRVVERVCREEGIDLGRALAVAVEIDETIEQQRRAQAGAKLSGSVFRGRLDVLIFIQVVAWGWGRTRRAGKSVIVENSPVSMDPRLGYPTRSRIAGAVKRVRTTCPEQAALYRRAFKDWREARERFLAARHEETWQWYLRGDGNRGSVAYRSSVDSRRRGGKEHFRSRRRFRYLAHELLPREQERERAAREMKEADAVLSATREKLFELMGVPPEFHSFV